MRKLYISVLFLLSFILSGCVQSPEFMIESSTPSSWGNSSSSNQNSATQSSSTTIDVSDLNDTVQESRIVNRIPFPVQEYARLPKSGTATVKGRIYLIDSYGDKIYGRQTRLYLNPVTSYSRQWYQESYINHKKMQKADDRLFNYMKFTTSGNQGEFAFYNVPAGNYYLIGVVKCAQACGYDTPQNVAIVKEIRVPNGAVLNVDLSKSVE